MSSNSGVRYGAACCRPKSGPGVQFIPGFIKGFLQEEGGVSPYVPESLASFYLRLLDALNFGKIQNASGNAIGLCLS